MGEDGVGTGARPGASGQRKPRATSPRHERGKDDGGERDRERDRERRREREREEAKRRRTEEPGAGGDEGRALPPPRRRDDRSRDRQRELGRPADGERRAAGADDGRRRRRTPSPKSKGRHHSRDRAPHQRSSRDRRRSRGHADPPKERPAGGARERGTGVQTRDDPAGRGDGSTRQPHPPPPTGAPAARAPAASPGAWYQQPPGDGSEEEEEEEDEQAKERRLLEEAARRRAAIQAKYAAAPQQQTPSSPTGEPAGASPVSPQSVSPSVEEVSSATHESSDGGASSSSAAAPCEADPAVSAPPGPEEVSPPVRGPEGGGGGGGFDMFSDSAVAPLPPAPGAKGDIPADDGFLPHLAPEMQAALRENWDDDDGYYAFRVGEVLRGEGAQQYQVVGKYGRGVFSIVLHCTDLATGADVAIKVLRSNDHMTKCGMKEMEILKLLMEKDRHQRKHCVQYLGSFEHKNHLCIAFEPLKLNLRELLKKYGKENGKEVGITLEATRLYTRQLMAALRHLKDNLVIHADLKPDNIMLNDKCNVLKVADFGSAVYLHEGGITPYLVSRFYRPPEVVLGLGYDCAVDMWSAAATLYELFTGKVCFPGRTNNNMLARFMQLRGKFPNKMLKRAAFCGEHFTEQFHFKAKEVDPVSKKEVVRIKAVTGPEVSLKGLILQHTADTDDRRVALLFVDFLDKALALDPAVRLKPEDALRHPFVADP